MKITKVRIRKLEKDNFNVKALAEVTLDISTIEAMTASVYSQMLWMKSQSTGSFNADVSPVVEAAKEMGNAAMNKVKEWF